MSDKVNWLAHEFTVYKPDADWNDVGGVYIFCGLNSKNQWQPYYIGQADSLRKRLGSHEKWDAAVKLGATHIHAITIQTQDERDKVEKELIRTWKPPLNEHHTG